MAGAKMDETQAKSIGKLEIVVSDVYAYAHGAPAQDTKTTRGTVFGAYNAVTGYLQNVKKVKSQEKQLVSLMEGTAFDYGQAAFDLCKNLL